MKNNKNTTIFLLVAVLGIWGYLIYIFFIETKSDIENPVLDNTNIFEIDTTTVVPVNQELSLDYADPFFKVRRKKVVKKRKIIKKKQRKKKVFFPKISYDGFIGNGENITFYLISIKQHQMMFKLNDIHEDVQLIKGDKESVTLSYKEEIKEFTKK